MDTTRSRWALPTIKKLKLISTIEPLIALPEAQVMQLEK
jgi:hypothetical protein